MKEINTYSITKNDKKYEYDEAETTTLTNI